MHTGAYDFVIRPKSPKLFLGIPSSCRIPPHLSDNTNWIFEPGVIRTTIWNLQQGRTQIKTHPGLNLRACHGSWYDSFVYAVRQYACSAHKGGWLAVIDQLRGYSHLLRLGDDNGTNNKATSASLRRTGYLRLGAGTNPPLPGGWCHIDRTHFWLVTLRVTGVLFTE